MSADTTTIKVPRDLRDRIAQQAQAEKFTFAEAISHALDLVDHQSFWAQVAAGTASMSEAERETYRNNDTLLDDLADSNDDRLSVTDAW